MLGATTTVSVLRTSEEDVDFYDRGTDEAYEVVLSGIEAHISSPGGSEVFSADMSQSNLRVSMVSDVIDLKATDRVLDEKTGQMYQVAWTYNRRDPFLPQTQASLSVITKE